MINLKNKKCLVTGGTRGIGREIVILLLKEGCKVLGVGQKDGDLSKDYGIGDVIDCARDLLKEVDILINCAGVYLNNPISKTDSEDYDYIFNVNVKAPWILCQEFSPEMIKNNWGRIVNFGSVASYHGHKNQSVYNASKHAILGMSRALFKEFNDYGIRVICVSPSGVQTDMGQECLGNQDINTFLEPKEIAEHVVFNLKFDSQLVNTEIQLNRIHIEKLEKIM